MKLCKKERKKTVMRVPNENGHCLLYNEKKSGQSERETSMLREGFDGWLEYRDEGIILGRSSSCTRCAVYINGWAPLDRELYIYYTVYALPQLVCTYICEWCTVYICISCVCLICLARVQSLFDLDGRCNVYWLLVDIEPWWMGCWLLEHEFIIY